MKNNKLTLIIPFFNENQKIIRSMKIILSQISKPDEIIFINNSSKDNSEIKLKLFIKSINLKFKNNIKIINNKKSLPSTAKNLGVKIAKHNYVVFFDIGLSTNNYFIYKIKNKIRPDPNFYIQGKFFFKSEDKLDRSYLMQTYGFHTYGDCIPSSCFHKSIFTKIGYFENYRSGYDKVWLRNLKNKKQFTFYENKMSSINYMKNVSGRNLYSIFRKIFHYSFTSVGLKNYNLDKIYIVMILMFLLVLFTANIFLFFSFYIILRAILIPLKKNKGMKLKNLKFQDLLLLPIVGITIDIARSFGFILGYLSKSK